MTHVRRCKKKREFFILASIVTSSIYHTHLFLSCMSRDLKKDENLKRTKSHTLKNITRTLHMRARNIFI